MCGNGSVMRDARAVDWVTGDHSLRTLPLGTPAPSSSTCRHVYIRVRVG